MNVREGKIPEGKGIFVHILSTAWNGSMAALADYLADNGYTWIAPKMQDGSLAFDSGGQQKLLEELAPELKRVGVDLVGWGFVYGETNAYRKWMKWCDKEIAITIDMIAKYSPTAWIVNAEAPYKAAGASDSAKKYMDGIKAEMAITNDAVPDIPIGFSSYKFPESHNLPWVEFLSRSDFACPQVYWWGDTRPDGGVAQLEKSIQQYKYYGADNMVFVPAGTFRSDDGTWWATVEQIDKFNEACYNDNDIIGMNYWDLRFLQQRDTLENALNDFVWDVEETPLPPTGECDLTEVLVALSRIQKDVADIETNLAAHHLEVMAKLNEVPESTVTVNNDGKNVYLSYYMRKNAQGYPIFVFYPGDSAPVADRVFVASGAKLYVTGKVRGDGGVNAWKLDMSKPIPLMAGSAPVPDVQLYVMEKFAQ